MAYLSVIIGEHRHLTPRKAKIIPFFTSLGMAFSGLYGAYQNGIRCPVWTSSPP